jgi:hypothetical protein
MFYGSKSGLSASRRAVITRNTDGHADLVTAGPDESDGAADGALGGRLLVWYGSARGIAWEAEPV